MPNYDLNDVFLDIGSAGNVIPVIAGSFANMAFENTSATIGQLYPA